MKEQFQAKRRDVAARDADVTYNGGPDHVIIGPQTGEKSLQPPQQQFLVAVEKAMEGPFIRYSKRLQLMELAKALKIGRFQANLVIAQVLQRAGGIVPNVPDPYESTVTPTADSAAPKTDGREKFFLFGALFIIAALVDLALIRFVFAR